MHLVFTVANNEHVDPHKIRVFSFLCIYDTRGCSRESAIRHIPTRACRWLELSLGQVMRINIITSFSQPVHGVPHSRGDFRLRMCAQIIVVSTCLTAKSFCKVKDPRPRRNPTSVATSPIPSWAGPPVFFVSFLHPRIQFVNVKSPDPAHPVGGQVAFTSQTIDGGLADFQVLRCFFQSQPGSHESPSPSPLVVTKYHIITFLSTKGNTFSGRRQNVFPVGKYQSARILVEMEPKWQLSG